MEAEVKRPFPYLYKSMPKTKSIFNWSGGKDSSLCLHKVLQAGEYEVTRLVTTVSSPYNRIAQHGVRTELLERQTATIGIPLHKIMLPEWPTMEVYDNLMRENLSAFRQQNISASIFGDIFLEDLRQYREARLAEINIQGIFPLWKISTKKLAKEFIELGFRAIIVCVDEKHLDKSFAGREFDRNLLNDLPATVDPCGEYGEFHSFVYDGPLFSKPVKFTRGEIVYRKYLPPLRKTNDTVHRQSVPATGFWYCDLLPA